MATLMNYLDRFLPQEYSRTLFDTVRGIDPVFSRIKNTWENVEPDAVSNSWRAQQIFTTGVAGAVRFRSSQGTASAAAFASATTAAGAWSQGTLQTRIPFTEAINTGEVQRAIQLVEMEGTMVLPLHVLRAEGLKAMVARRAIREMKGCARNNALLQANAFYNGPTGYLIQDLGDVSVTCSGTGTAKIVIDTSLLAANGGALGGALARFEVGQTVDIYKDGGSDVPSTKRNTKPWVVTDVDRISGKTITIESIDGTETIAIDGGDAIGKINDNDMLFPSNYLAGAAGNSPGDQGPYGFLDWCKNSGTLFGTAYLPNGGTSAIDLALYSHFKSLIASEGSVYLSEALLNKRMAAFWMAYQGLYRITHAVTTAGVLNGYLAGIESLVTYNRGVGAELRLKEGFVGLDYQYMGQPMEIMVSAHMPAGEMWGMDLSDGNIQRFVPPTMPNAGKDGTVGGVEFVNPAQGGSSIWRPCSLILEAGGTAQLPVLGADFKEAPYSLLYNIAPQRIPSVRLYTLLESL